MTTQIATEATEVRSVPSHRLTYLFDHAAPLSGTRNVTLATG